MEVGYVNKRCSDFGINTSEGQYVVQAPLGYKDGEIPVITPEGKVVKMTRDQVLKLILHGADYIGLKTPLPKDTFEKNSF